MECHNFEILYGNNATLQVLLFFAHAFNDLYRHFAITQNYQN